MAPSVGDGVVDLGRRLSYPSLAEALTDTGLVEVRSAVASGAPDARLADVTFLPVIPSPSRILCIGVNYRDHAVEAAREETGNPSVFIRLTSSVVGHGQPILRPRISTQLDYEGELAVVIGSPGHYIPRGRALEHVAGYSCFNDASVRDWQRHNPGPTPGKNFFRCGSFGPWLVTADEIEDPVRLELTTTVNGVEVQHTTTDLMIYDVPTIIEYVSSFTPLLPGDVISTGTPAGVGMGRKPPLWLKPGDTVAVTISGIGTLENSIADDDGLYDGVTSNR
jgi:2-keto-4-pentenoate hydratase/2-oxohepta-3-ene-1,7-dioic acid hydratase in catechol pathway